MERRLNLTDRQRIIDLYEGRYREHGRNIKTVGWGAVEDQILRFDVLTRGLDLVGLTVMDVGCGLGDMIPFLEGQVKDNFAYIGVDISKALVDDASKAYGAADRTFLAGDILDMPDLKPVDVTLLSGALNFRIENNLSHAKAMISRMFGLSKQTASVNFLSTYVDFENEKNFHHSPEEMFSFARTLTPWVTLYHDYPLYEFTLQLHRYAR